MSNDSYSSYRGSGTGRDAGLYMSDNREERRSAEERRRERLEADAARAREEAPRATAKPAAPAKQEVKPELARNTITNPPKKAKKIIVILVDNSGSNRRIANAIKAAAGYIHAFLGIIAPDITIVIVFFSDHCDGDKILQEVDYTAPGEKGEHVLRASIDKIRPADGGDAPEAIECALLHVAEIEFGHIARENRQLILVTDQVAHGMGYPDGDSGCPEQCNWKASLRQAHASYGSIQVVASGNDPSVFELQKQFVSPDRLSFDLVNLATGRLNHDERCRLVPNAILFLVARGCGLQTVEAFLMALLEKWLENPQYGSETLPRAKHQIDDFLKYLEGSTERVAQMRERIFPDIDE